MRDPGDIIEAFKRPDYHVLVTGNSRTGKSVYVKEILRRSERFVALDRKRDYVDLDRATVVSSYHEARGYLDRHRNGKCRLVVSTSETEHQLAVIRYLWEMFSVMELPNLLVVLEEAKHYSRSNRSFVQEPEGLALNSDGKSYLELIYTEALLYGLVMCTVTQFPTQIATTSRRASDWKIAFRYTGSLPDSMSSAFYQYDNLLPRLDRLEPGVEPVRANDGGEGHFLTYPDELEPLEELPPMFSV